MTDYFENLEIEAWKVAEATEKFGGNFFKALGVALRYADMNNKVKIKDTWETEWNEYLELYETGEQRDRAQKAERSKK